MKLYSHNYGRLHNTIVTAKNARHRESFIRSHSFMSVTKTERVALNLEELLLQNLNPDVINPQQTPNIVIITLVRHVEIKFDL